jgi:hypothetical protein
MISIPKEKRELVAEDLFETIKSLNGILPPHDLGEVLRDSLTNYCIVDRAIIYAIIQQKINIQSALLRFRN